MALYDLQALRQKSPIMTRKWNSLTTSICSEKFKFKLMSWNMLAQSLVRRDLFPTSDCLKAAQREGMLFNEILTHKADIICLQEADRLEKLIPMLESVSYNHVYANGPGKRHGSIIAYSTALFETVGHSVVLYDNLRVNGDVDSSLKDGIKELTRVTKNVGLIIGLKRLNASDGFVIATTHLFWHPRFTYERIRQTILLLQEIEDFRRQHALNDWPCIIAGDFNFPPTDPGYALLVGETLSQEQWKIIDRSRVIHVTVDSTFADSDTVTPADEDDDPDTEITHSRCARASDALLSNEEILGHFKRLSSLRSAYDEAQRMIANESSSTVFGSRLEQPFPSHKVGYYEPSWTSYTHFWKSTLDYMFILNDHDPRIELQGFLQIPDTSILEPGLPMKDKCGSDHISLVVEIAFKLKSKLI